MLLKIELLVRGLLNIGLGTSGLRALGFLILGFPYILEIDHYWLAPDELFDYLDVVVVVFVLGRYSDAVWIRHPTTINAPKNRCADLRKQTFYGAGKPRCSEQRGKCQIHFPRRFAWSAHQIIASTSIKLKRILAIMNKLPPQEWQKLKILRQEQRDAVNRLNLLENDLSETKLVNEALQLVDPERKCYRSQGDILVEQKVKDVIPALDKSREQLETMVISAKKEMVDKGKAIQAFMTEHNLRMK